MAARRRKASLDNFREGVLGSDRVSMPARGYLDALSSDRSGPEQEGVRIPITRRWALSTDLSSQRMLSPAAFQQDIAAAIVFDEERGEGQSSFSRPNRRSLTALKQRRSMPFRSEAPWQGLLVDLDDARLGAFDRLRPSMAQRLVSGRRASDPLQPDRPSFLSVGGVLVHNRFNRWRRPHYWD